MLCYVLCVCIGIALLGVLDNIILLGVVIVYSLLVGWGGVFD